MVMISRMMYDVAWALTQASRLESDIQVAIQAGCLGPQLKLHFQKVPKVQGLSDFLRDAKAGSC